MQRERDISLQSPALHCPYVHMKHLAPNTTRAEDIMMLVAFKSLIENQELDKKRWRNKIS